MNMQKNMPMAVHIIGASGFVGSAIFDWGEKLQYDTWGTYYATRDARRNLIKLDLKDNVYEAPTPPHFKTIKNKTAVLCACISSIDFCAKEKEAAWQVNVTNTINLIKVLKDCHYKIVFISTDNVFDGKKENYIETDKTCPLNEYGRQKVTVEDYLIKHVKDALIVRLSKVCADYSHPKNLFSDWTRWIEREGKIPCIKNQFFSPTCTEDIAKGIFLLLQQNKSGIFHLCHQPWSRTDLAKEFVKRLEKKRQVSIVERDLMNFNFFDKRPLKAILNNQKIITTVKMSFCPMETVIDRFIRNSKIFVEADS